MISVDTLEDNKGFAEKEKADFPMLANPDKKVAYEVPGGLELNVRQSMAASLTVRSRSARISMTIAAMPWLTSAIAAPIQ